MALEHQNLFDSDKLIFIFSISIIAVFVIAVFVTLMAVDTIPQAEGAYCASTCQKEREAAEVKEREKDLADRKEANKIEYDEDGNVKIKSSTSVKQRCYGIYCDKETEKQANNATTLADLIETFNSRNFISIRLSTSCTLIDYCPTVKELATAYDNSNKYLSGDFIEGENGKWVRESPRVKNVFEFYKFINQPWVLWVDPDDYTFKRTKQITIHPHISAYADSQDIFEYQTRVEYKNIKYEECYFAKIGWKDKETGEIIGKELLLDVLNHFYSNCKEPINYDPKFEIFVKSTIFPDCDKECFDYKRQMQLVDKAYHELQREEYDDEEDDDDDEKKCYGIYCDREDEDDKDDENKTKKEKLADRIRQLEDIQLCERFKLKETSRTNDRVDCEDEDDRQEYLEDKIKEETDLNPDILECERFRVAEQKLENSTQATTARKITCLDKFERNSFLDQMREKYPDGL